VSKRRIAFGADGVSAEHSQRQHSPLFFPGRAEKRVSQPIGFCPARTLYGIVDRLRFIRRQPDGEDNGDTFCRKPWSAHFLFHATQHFRKLKCLTSFWTFVYKKQASNFGAKPFQQSARTSLERLANQRHPAVTGAGIQRLAMKADRFQVRHLKIEPIGDFFRGKIKPRIRITGHWLERAGFKPGHRVEIRVEQPGTMTLRFLEQSGVVR
jgi:hypothetical protein